MKNITICFVSVVLLIASLGVFKRTQSLEYGFKNPPKEYRPLTYWNWISGCVSKEGIDADLAALSEAGVGGVHMFNASMYLPIKDLKYGSENWFEYVAYAVKQCKKYGLEFTIMNCDGWSQAGGPWITPEQSMKKLVFSETFALGAQKFSGTVAKPLSNENFYKDIAVYLVETDANPDLQTEKISLTKEGLNDVLSFEFHQDVNKSLLELRFAKASKFLEVKGRLEAWSDTAKWVNIEEFYYEGKAVTRELAISFPNTKSKKFRFIFEAKKPDESFIDVKNTKLKNLNKLPNYVSEAGLASLTTLKANSKIPASKIIKLDTLPDENDKLSCDIPQGSWTILRLGYTTTGAKNKPAQPEGMGLEVDKLESEFVEHHFENALGRILKESKKFSGKALKGVLADSWECGFQNWTQKFPQYFKEYKGYDLDKWLPVLAGYVVDNSEVSLAFLSDFRDCISYLTGKNFYAKFRELANKNKMLFYTEPYEGCMANEFDAAQNVDVIMGEFWLNPDISGPDLWNLRKNSSASHLSGRMVTGAESFTSREEYSMWKESPKWLKGIGDLAFTAGVNRYILHTTAHQPNELKPGFSLGRYGTHFGRTNTWWKDSKAYFDYVTRVQYMLQKTKPVADILVLNNGDFGVRDSGLAPKIPQGYYYEVCSPKYFLGAKIKDGAKDGAPSILFDSGMSFRAVITSAHWRASLEVLKKLYEFKTCGGILLGNAPYAPASLKDVENSYELWADLVEKIWPQKTYSYDIVETNAALSKTIQKDFDFEFDHFDGQKDLRFIHQKTRKNEDIYFIANVGDEDISGKARFRVLGKNSKAKYPQIWNALDGSINTLPIFKVERDYISINMDLEPKESVFIVFKNGLLKETKIKLTDKNSQDLPLGLDGYVLNNSRIYVKENSENLKALEWNLEFKDMFQESFNTTFEKLSDWKDSSDERVKYFSGTAKYASVVEIKKPEKDERVFLDLGKVETTARVCVNGKLIGTLWVSPYRLDITDALLNGENKIEIDVTNTWANRLIGDERFEADTEYNHSGSAFSSGRLDKFPPWYEDPQKTLERKRKTFVIWNFFNKDSPLESSGLLGPVRLELYKEYILKN